MQVLNIFHVLVAIAMVAFILVQRGPGATAGAAFGSGASGTVFGSRGAGSFLSRSTWVLGMLFCLVSLVMAVVVSRDLAAPETDLGVIGSPTTTEEVIVPEMNDPASDLPALDALLEEGAQSVVDEAESDLPVVDAAEVEEGAQPAGTAEDDSDG